MSAHNAIHTLSPQVFPPLLQEIADPPERLFVRGTLPNPVSSRFLAVVGSRRFTRYGHDACERLISGLRGTPVVIVSGLALGIDALAHKHALAAGLRTIAIPGSGIADDVLYPRQNVSLARHILENDGALLSEYAPDFKATQWSFPKRNRIMAGLSHATLVIEASERSGTLITARLAMEYNRDVLVVPHPITSASGRGSNALLRQGATAVTSADDILEALKIEKEQAPSDAGHANLSEDEKRILELLHEPMEKDELIRAFAMPTHKANILLSAMEVKGLIVERLGQVYLGR